VHSENAGLGSEVFGDHIIILFGFASRWWPNWSSRCSPCGWSTTGRATRATGTLGESAHRAQCTPSTQGKTNLLHWIMVTCEEMFKNGSNLIPPKISKGASKELRVKRQKQAKCYSFVDFSIKNPIFQSVKPNYSRPFIF
jgi:hypothetical protein